EVARPLTVGLDALRDAQRADMVFHSHALDAPLYGQEDPASLSELIGQEDPQVEHTLDMESVFAHWTDLPEREQRILTMRFYGNMTQAEIGDRLGISQMHVSPLLARALRYLRDRLLADGEEAAPGRAGRPPASCGPGAPGASTPRSASMVMSSRSLPWQNSTAASWIRERIRSGVRPARAATSPGSWSSK